MAAPYASQSIVNYNTNPPPDDGTESDLNEVTWAKHKSKLADPIKTLAEAINNQLGTAFGKVLGGGGVTSYGTSSTVQASDQGKLVRASNSGITITTPDADSVEAPFVFAFLNNGGGNVTLDGNGSQTIDGDASLVVPDKNGFVVFTDGTNWFTSGRSGVVNKLDATAAPTADDDSGDGYAVGSLWVDVTNDRAYICVDATSTAAVWWGAFATQAQMEAGTASDKIVTPAVFHHHPGVAKAWCKVDRSAGTPTLDAPDYNVDSVTDDGAGQTIVTIGTDFSGGDYACGANALSDSSRAASAHTPAVGSFKVECFAASTGTADDTTSFTCWAFGDQA